MQQQNEVLRAQESTTASNAGLSGPNAALPMPSSDAKFAKSPKSHLASSSSLPQSQDEALQDHLPQIMHYLSRFLQPLEPSLWMPHEPDRREMAETSDSTQHSR